MGATTIDGAAKLLSTPLTEQLPTETENVEVQEAPKPEDATAAPETSENDDTQSEVERYTVKVNGEEKQVTVDEMRSGYMMESDYRKKSTEVAEKRKALDTRSAEIDTQLGEAQALLGMELNDLNSPEMQELKQTDPDMYLKELDKVQGKVKKFQALQGKRQEERQRLQQDLAGKEREALDRAIPEWLDPDVKSKEAQAVMKRWESQGYKPQEIETTMDHRRFVDGRKAMLYDQLMSQDLSSKEVKTAPKSQKPSAASDKVTAADQSIKGMRQGLKKSGKVHDAAAIFKQMLKE